MRGFFAPLRMTNNRQRRNAGILRSAQNDKQERCGGGFFAPLRMTNKKDAEAGDELEKVGSGACDVGDGGWGAGAESGVSAGGAFAAGRELEQLLRADAGFIAGTAGCVHDDCGYAGAEGDGVRPRAGARRPGARYQGPIEWSYGSSPGGVRS